MQKHHSIDYVEIPSRDLNATKHFFEKAFDFRFTDYGPEYTAFDRCGVDGGFFLAEDIARTAIGSALVILFSNDLEATEAKVIASGGTICKAIFSFPGGRRFHFLEPGGSEFAVWTTT